MKTTLTREFIQEQIWIDTDVEFTYGQDQAYINYPVIFPVVCFSLVGSDGLYKLADKIRMEAGHKGILNGEGYTDGGWYDFYICINGWGKTRVDNCITFIPIATEEDDDECEYTIDLDENEQIMVYFRLDELCREEFGKSCKELLQEAETFIEKERKD